MDFKCAIFALSVSIVLDKLVPRLMMTLTWGIAALVTVVRTVTAQHGSDSIYGPGESNNNVGFGGDSSGRGGPSQSFIESRQRMLIAHGILASLAFVILFPAGSILIRLGSFRGAWLIHGLFQLFAYFVYTAAVGIGIRLAQQAPAQIGLLNSYHPIIGLMLFALLFFQPIMGYVHHLLYKKYQRRTLWSHGHFWLGRIAITLGMINGGLGLLLAYDAPLGFAPGRGHVIAYGVIAALIWLVYVIAATIGERRRAFARTRFNDKNGKVIDREDASAGSLASHNERYG